MPKMKRHEKTLEGRLMHNHEAEKNLPYILKEAIKQADYLPDLVVGNQIVPNRYTGEERVLTPLAYQVYRIAIFANDIMWHLDTLSKTLEGLPVTDASVELIRQTRKNHQTMYDTNKTLYFAACDWFCDNYVEDYVKLLG